MIAMIESDLDTSNVQNERQEETKARWAWSDYITWKIRSASAVAKETCSHMILMRLDWAFSLASWHCRCSSIIDDDWLCISLSIRVLSVVTS